MIENAFWLEVQKQIVGLQYMQTQIKGDRYFDEVIFNKKSAFVHSVVTRTATHYTTVLPQDTCSSEIQSENNIIKVINDPQNRMYLIVIF